MRPASTREINKQIFLYLGIFSPFFSRADFENVVILLLGLLSDTKNKTVAGIAEAIEGLKDHSVLSKFLCSSRLSTYYLKLEMKRLFLKMVDESKPVFFYLDDTLVEKAGKKVKAAYNYSVSDGKCLFSNCFVFALVKNGNLELPFDFEKYFPKKEKNFKSKIALALLLFKRFSAWYGKQAYVLFDCWYSAYEIIDYLNGEKVTYITRVKSNRVVLLDFIKLKLSDYAKNLSPKLFKENKFGNKSYFLYSEVLHLNKIGKVKVIFSKKKKHGRKTIFIITNELDLDEAFAVENYIHRWEIEQFFKDMKQHFGFEEYQETKQVGVTRHITLQLVAYFLVSFVRNSLETGRTVLSIGETLKKIRKSFSDVKRAFLERLVRKKYDVNLSNYGICDR